MEPKKQKWRCEKCTRHASKEKPTVAWKDISCRLVADICSEHPEKIRRHCYTEQNLGGDISEGPIGFSKTCRLPRRFGFVSSKPRYSACEKFTETQCWTSLNKCPCPERFSKLIRCDCRTVRTPKALAAYTDRWRNSAKTVNDARSAWNSNARQWCALNRSEPTVVCTMESNDKARFLLLLLASLAASSCEYLTFVVRTSFVRSHVSVKFRGLAAVAIGSLSHFVFARSQVRRGIQSLSQKKKRKLQDEWCFQLKAVLYFYTVVNAMVKTVLSHI